MSVVSCCEPMRFCPSNRMLALQAPRPSILTSLKYGCMWVVTLIECRPRAKCRIEFECPRVEGQHAEDRVRWRTRWDTGRGQWGVCGGWRHIRKTWWTKKLDDRTNDIQWYCRSPSLGQTKDHHPHHKSRVPQTRPQRILSPGIYPKVLDIRKGWGEH